MDTLPRPHDDEAALHPHRLVKAAYPHYGADAADLTVQGAVPGPAGVSAAPATWPPGGSPWWRWTRRLTRRSTR